MYSQYWALLTFDVWTRASTASADLPFKALLMPSTRTRSHQHSCPTADGLTLWKWALETAVRFGPFSQSNSEWLRGARISSRSTIWVSIGIYTKEVIISEAFCGGKSMRVQDCTAAVGLQLWTPAQNWESSSSDKEFILSGLVQTSGSAGSSCYSEVQEHRQQALRSSRERETSRSH